MPKFKGVVQPPVIFVPGITASHLRDEYDIPPTSIWSQLLNKKYDRIKLHPDNPRFEVREPARVTADYVFELAYQELIEELRHNLSAKADSPVPVYPFAYDWRQPLEVIEAGLARFVEEVIERTKLMRHYAKKGYGQTPQQSMVSLVGHSMGGLVITGYLQKFGASKVSKVATLATPFQGSYEAVIKITTGTANLGASPPSSRERESARVTPALYYLLPSFQNAVKVPKGFPNELFDPVVWQTSITASIEEYFRLYGFVPKGRKAQASALFQRMLMAAKTHRRRMNSLKLKDVGLEPQDWLGIVGIDTDTRVHLEIEVTKSGPKFKLQSSDRMNHWADPSGERAHLTGDGTVPFLGAVPSFLERENLVCVSPDDFGYWELQDKALSKTAGFHGALPNMNMLHRLIVRHFTGRPDRHGNTWGRPAPGVTKETWNPPIEGLQVK